MGLSWLDAYYRRLPAKYQRLVFLGLGGLLIMGVVYMAVSHTSGPKPRQEPKKVRAIVGGPKDQQLKIGLIGVSQQLEELRKENQKLQEKLEKLESGKPGSSQNPEQIKVDIMRQVQAELAKVQQREESKEKKPEKASEPPKSIKEAPRPEKPSERAGARAAGRKGKQGAETPKEAQAGALGPSGAKEIKVIAAKQAEGELGQASKVKGAARQEMETFLPAGSILSGTLLTGLDVSCGQSSKKDPFPVLMRVKKEAILPNRYRADVRECFLLAAGWGDLGSERAYLRGEKLSCIREDGKALESKIEMYAVGEDGKAGVRGRLVSKSGALLSKALLAGFMEGFSQLFSKQPVLTISTRTHGTQPYQAAFSKDALQGAGLEGAGSALERLAKYYIDMAKDIFPVIEIDAGRAIDFVLINGVKLKLQGSRQP